MIPRFFPCIFSIFHIHIYATIVYLKKYILLEKWWQLCIWISTTVSVYIVFLLNWVLSSKLSQLNRRDPYIYVSMNEYSTDIRYLVSHPLFSSLYTNRLKTIYFALFLLQLSTGYYTSSSPLKLGFRCNFILEIIGSGYRDIYQIRAYSHNMFGASTNTFTVFFHLLTCFLFPFLQYSCFLLLLITANDQFAIKWFRVFRTERCFKESACH